MDIELRKLLKELSSQLLETLGKDENVPNDKQCSCSDIFKGISVKLREFDEALETSLEPQTKEPIDEQNDTTSGPSQSTVETDQLSTPKQTVKARASKSSSSSGPKSSSPSEPKSSSSSEPKSSSSSEPKSSSPSEPKSSSSSEPKSSSSSEPKGKQEISPREQRLMARKEIAESNDVSHPVRGQLKRKFDPKYDVRVRLDRIDRPKRRRRDSDDFRPASMDPLVDEIPKSSTQNGTHSRYAMAMEKRKSVLRNTIALDRPIAEDTDDDDDDNERNMVKNTNRNMYYANNLYKLCVLCNKKDARLVLHYLKHHSDHEVLIARPSPAMANVIRTKSQNFELHKGKLSGVCYFCEEMKAMQIRTWKSHLLTHTGESMYLCTGCDTAFKQKTSHSNCGTEHFTSIYDLSKSNESNGALEGYICAECNYLQIGEEQLMNHLTSQHGYGMRGIDKHYEKVTLIPDISHVRTSIRYDFIEPDTLFKCTICNAQTADYEELEEHISEEHAQIEEYVCCCNQKLPSHNLTALAHLFNHYPDLYRCMSCNDKDATGYYRAQGILKHISNEHTKDVWTFQHIQRQTDEQTIVSEFRLNKYVCNVCGEEFAKAMLALNHFKAEHPRQITDIKTLVSKKQSQLGDKSGDTITNFVASQSGYVLRQSFLCTKCNYQSTSKEDLLAHHNDFHPETMFEMNPGSTMLIHLEPNAPEDEKVNGKFDRFMVYSCYQCYENNDSTSINSRFIDGTAKRVYDHWFNEHRNAGHPFRFYIETLVQCHYCDMISTYKGMLDHIGQIHSKLQICFSDVNANDKCPMCDHTCSPSDLPEHFQNEHSMILEVNMLNPNRLTEEQFQRLLNIDVYTKPMCDHCGEMFNLDDEYNAHHELKHAAETKRARNVIDKSHKGLIAVCCNKYLAPQDFFTHLSMHTFQFSCQQCNETKPNLPTIEEAAQHDMIKHNTENSLGKRCRSLNRTLRKMFIRTKVFYGNGVVLYKANLFGTRQDDMEVFESYLSTKNQDHANRFNTLLETSSNSTKND
ncbi:zinc finger protein 37-like [Sitodiplosis mosellana]|uniref:zinc finger protein 37-like n=1 Tax=Sitodiplosis mosellana TaxID=263140 RepID=UPI002444FF73|nr:zinc finger protein 37-like [Sitodiplosis mosellana]